MLNIQGKPDEAADCYRRALELSPDYAEAHNNLGIVLNGRGELQEAVEHYQRALALKPDYAEAYYNLGIAFGGRGKWDEAVTYYRRALALKPNYIEAHNNLGNALNNQGKLDEAETQYRRALAVMPDFAEVHYNLGVVLNAKGRPDEAVACYRRALELKPDYAEAHANIGSAFNEKGELDEAIAHYRRALVLKPEFAEAHLNMGATHQQLGRLVEAEASYRRVLDIDPGDSLGAGLLLASLDRERLPMRASEAHLDALYAKRSHNWDLEKTYYFGDELVAGALKQLSHESKKLDILDAGCGTGLVGILVRDLATKLDGIDMSSAMLEKAREKNIYDEIHLGDLLSFMADHPKSYDAITCAATLIHFGDLRPVFAAAASSLRDGGLFVFSLFSSDDGHNNQNVVVHPNSSLARGGCYAHSSGYVSHLAEAAGFFVDLLDHRVHEYHKKIIPVTGLVVGLRRKFRGAN